MCIKLYIIHSSLQTKLIYTSEFIISMYTLATQTMASDEQNLFFSSSALSNVMKIYNPTWKHCSYWLLQYV